MEVGMASEPFAERVRALRDSWTERRQVKSLASAHDFDSQFRLLVTLHQWVLRGVEDIREVYGPEMEIRVSPRPAARDTGFSVIVGDTFVLSFQLVERLRMGTAGWFIAAEIAGTSAPGNPVAAGPQRRFGQWTRGGIEDLLLTLMGAYERSLADPEALVGAGSRG